MGVLWSKILRDIWGNKGRTLQIVLIIGIGAAAIGMILTTREVMVAGMTDIWTSAHPAMINLFVAPAASEEDIYALRRVEGVQQIEGYSNSTIEWRLSPQEEWRQGGLTARADYDHQVLNTLELVSGPWPHDKVLAIDQGSDTFFGIPLGGMVYLRVNDRVVKVTTEGVVYNTWSQPAYFGGTAQFYATQDFYGDLVGDTDFSRIDVSAVQWDEDAVAELGDRLQDKLEKGGIQSFRLITDPNKHFFQNQIDALFFMLGVLGVLSLLLGLLLVYNTMNALIGRQVDQIGVLKAVGARTGQILLLFSITVLIYGILALLLAVPLGVLGGWTIASWLVGSFGADIGGFQFSWNAILLMAAITLLAPLLASLLPIFSGARITVREAVSTYGLATKSGTIERVGARLRFVSRMLLLTISNTFRNKWRVILMEISLVLSGLIFMMVVSVRDSVIYTVNDVFFQILGADVTLLFEDPERIDYIRNLTLTYPGVRDVEVWDLRGVTMRPAGQPESEDDQDATIFGVPLPTDLYGYQLRAGRWLDHRDSHAIVLNQVLAEDVGVGVGDWVTVKYDENREQDWQVVGLVFDPVITTSANVPLDVILRDVHEVGRGASVWIGLENQDPEAQIAIAKDLRAYFEKNNVDISAQRGVLGIGGDSTVETARTFINNFNFIIVLLGVMAIVIGLVGSIALSGALSLSVMERMREIGVLRAIGASNWQVARLFIGEGLILGWLSWLIALPLSLPAGKVMVSALGSAFQTELVYNYTPSGALLWLAIITVLSILASWLPARGATRVSVRQSLVYQ